MPKIDEVYKNLTNVDINEQRKLWDERGKGYYGEYLLFSELYEKIPGVCKILMNLQVPASNGKTTEIDLLMIHETGLYVFEAKHYKGNIYGKEQETNWTQYFRTVKNHTFPNPIKQNQYHVNALKLRYTGLPIYSYIVFTNYDCKLHVSYATQGVTVCQMWNIDLYLNEINKREKILSMEQIDNIFNDLSQFSPATNEQVFVDGEVQSLNNYANIILADYQKNIEEAEEHYRQLRKKTKKGFIISIAIAVLVCLTCIVTCVLTGMVVRQASEDKVEQAHLELEKFKKKFQQVDFGSLNKLSLKENFVEATHVSVVASQDWNNAVNLQFSLKWNGELYGASIDNNTKINVILKNGEVKEYSLSDNALPNAKLLRMGKGNAWYSAYKKYEFPVQQLLGLKMEDIKYIKLINCGVWMKDGNTPKEVDAQFEIKIYG